MQGTASNCRDPKNDAVSSPDSMTANNNVGQFGNCASTNATDSVERDDQEVNGGHCILSGNSKRISLLQLLNNLSLNMRRRRRSLFKA